MWDAAISLCLRPNHREWETASKYHKGVLKPRKAVQPSWKWMFTRGSDERVCTIYRGINVSWLWTWTVSKSMKVLHHHHDSLKVWRVKSWILQKRLFMPFGRGKNSHFCITCHSFSQYLFLLLTLLSSCTATTFWIMYPSWWQLIDP